MGPAAAIASSGFAVINSSLILWKSVKISVARTTSSNTDEKLGIAHQGRYSDASRHVGTRKGILQLLSPPLGVEGDRFRSHLFACFGHRSHINHCPVHVEDNAF